MQLESMGDFCVILLTQGMATIVDPEDYEKFASLSWYAQWRPHAKSHRAVRHPPTSVDPSRKLKLLHREILGHEGDLEVDHINGDQLDNRKCNLRLCTHAQNSRNRRIKKDSGFKGVSWHTRDHVWHAHIGDNYQHIHLGTFSNPIDAARAYDKAAVERFGEYAATNFEVK